MEQNNLPSTKVIVKRVLALIGIICLIVLLTAGIKYYQRNVSWNKLFVLTYIGTEENTQGHSMGRKYQIYNDSNNVYEIDCIYIEVSDAHEKYIVPYEVHITLQPHSEKEEIIRYTRIGEYFGVEEYPCNFVIKGFDYKKR